MYGENSCSVRFFREGIIVYNRIVYVNSILFEQKYNDKKFDQVKVLKPEKNQYKLHFEN